MNTAERTELEQRAFAEIEQKCGVAVQLNDWLADHPELSGQEYESSKRIAQLLEREGFRVELPFAGYDTAFKAVKGAGGHSRKIALLAEYDALPGVGHACGHCTSGSISVLAGIALAPLQELLDADIHIIGTPMEETDGAKCKMTEDGVFDGCDMAIMIHMMNHNCVDMKFLAMDAYRYRFRGQSAHAAAEPWKGRNALNGAQLMLHAVDMLRQHVTPDVRMHAVYTNGGLAPNVVPDTAELEIYLRAAHRDVLDSVAARVDKCAEGAAVATETTWEKWAVQRPYDNIKRNETGVEQLGEIYAEFGLKTRVNEPSGSSDIGNVSMVCPTFHPTLKIAEENVAIHSPEFAAAVKSEAAHEAIALGAKILALQVIRIFTDEEKTRRLREDFESQRS